VHGRALDDNRLGHWCGGFVFGRGGIGCDVIGRSGRDFALSVLGDFWNQRDAVAHGGSGIAHHCLVGLEGFEPDFQAVEIISEGRAIGGRLACSGGLAERTQPGRLGCGIRRLLPGRRLFFRASRLLAARKPATQ
jgi:hypothetical protein